MKAVIQRVSQASISINGSKPKSIGKGLVILLGIKDTDTLAVCPKFAEKCVGLRIFEDENGKLNLSAEDLGYEIMIVSNFTLYANTKKGKRPSFVSSAKPPISVDCYNYFVECVKKQNIKNIVTGEFGADMQINLTNDGPVTIVVDSDEWKK